MAEEEIPSFDPIKSKDNLHKFTDYKQDNQKDTHIFSTPTIINYNAFSHLLGTKLL